MTSPEDAVKLLRGEGCSQSVIAHCMAVRDLALTYAGKAGINRNLVEIGALLHDIGRAKTHSLAHAQVGADMCRSLGISEDIARIVERHIGGGMTPEECVEQGLQPRECVPETPEEKIVAHADNCVKGTKVITIEERLVLAKDLPLNIKKRMLDLAIEVEKWA